MGASPFCSGAVCASSAIFFTWSLYDSNCWCSFLKGNHKRVCECTSREKQPDVHLMLVRSSQYGVVLKVVYLYNVYITVCFKLEICLYSFFQNSDFRSYKYTRLTLRSCVTFCSLSILSTNPQNRVVQCG